MKNNLSICLFVYLFICLFVITGCLSSPNQDNGKQFSENGLSFYCPDGWGIDQETKSMYKDEWLAICESIQPDASSLAIFRWTHKDISQQDFFNTYKSEFKTRIEAQGSQVNYKDKGENKVDYVFAAGAETFRGTIETKECKNTRLVLFAQSLDEEWGANKKDFKQILESIRCD
jgi:hypothetical protein